MLNVTLATSLTPATIYHTNNWRKFEVTKKLVCLYCIYIYIILNYSIFLYNVDITKIGLIIYIDSTLNNLSFTRLYVALHVSYGMIILAQVTLYDLALC